jgi:vancomycin permeability regulator SanA
VRRRLRLLLLVAALPLVLVAAANAVVVLDARGEAAGSLRAVPHAQAALVLGAQVHQISDRRAGCLRLP